MALIKIKYIK